MDDVMLIPFYRVIASYLFKEHLADKVEVDSKHLVAREHCSGFDYEFTLSVKHLPKNGG